MAKRKRLTPPDPTYMGDVAPETKGMFPLGVAVTRTARKPAPIADVARDTSASAALEEMSRNWHAARAEGRLVIALEHDEIRMDHLQRDRVALDAEDLAALERSLKVRGQQTPVEVVALPDGRGYGLLSGWRRCKVLRKLYAETGEPRFATVQALLRRPEDAADAYRTMVEENEIRANLSHYERARVVLKAVEAGVFETEEAGLSGLFGSVPRARRSKIRSFLVVVHALEGALRYPEAVSERAGLDLSQRLRSEPALSARLRSTLAKADVQNAAMEQAVIAHVLQSGHPDPVPVRQVPQPMDRAGGGEALARHPGLTLRLGRGGALILSGPAVDDALQSALIDWLADRFAD